jgi:CheY-like chemotaxis protein
MVPLIAAEGIIFFSDVHMENAVLIIEDDADDQDIIKTLCKRVNICDDLVFLSDGVRALEYLRSAKEKPFLILCDINMPGMNGLDLRKQINNDEVLRKKSIPFIFFSTAASDTQIENAYDMTVQGFFLKENSFQETAETLDLIFRYWRKCKHPR